MSRTGKSSSPELAAIQAAANGASNLPTIAIAEALYQNAKSRITKKGPYPWSTMITAFHLGSVNAAAALHQALCESGKAATAMATSVASAVTERTLSASKLGNESPALIKALSLTKDAITKQKPKSRVQTKDLPSDPVLTKAATAFKSAGTDPMKPQLAAQVAVAALRFEKVLPAWEKAAPAASCAETERAYTSEKTSSVVTDSIASLSLTTGPRRK